MSKARSVISRTAWLALVAGFAIVLGAQPALAQKFCSVSTASVCNSDADCPGGEECHTFVDADVTTSTTWTSDNVYRLTGVRYVLNGATLTIEPGTVIRGEPNEPRCSVDGDLCTTDADCTDGIDASDVCLRDPGALVVTRGARIQAAGTDIKPIIFTNLDDDNLFANSVPDPNGDYESYVDAFDINGTWGGLIILGRGYTSNDTDNPGPEIAPNPARQLAVEGIQDRGRCTAAPYNACRTNAQCAVGVCDLFNGFYGDCASSSLSPDSCDDDDSGFMNYVSIRYGGDEVSAANEINGLTLGAVGRETELEYIEIANNFDDGVELFGGAVDIKHFVILNQGDDAVDYDEGWRGRGQFVFALSGRPISSDPRVGEHDGATGGDGGQPRAIPTFYNVTYIGAGGVGGGTPGSNFYDPAETYGNKDVNAAFIFRDNAGGHYYNSAFLNGGGALGLIEGSSSSDTDDETSGERTITAYALGDVNTFPTSAVGSAPAGNCDDPSDPNDVAIRALGCIDDTDCPGNAVCVQHYLMRTGSTYELELEDNTWHCFGQPLLDGSNIAHFPASLAEVSAAGGSSSRLHRDIPGLFDPASGLDNSYEQCSDPLPIRRLVRTDDLLMGFPVGDGQNQPIVDIDPRPAPGSSLMSTNRTAPSDGFFEVAPYRGAFGANNWAAKWTVTSRLGLFPSCNSATGEGPAPDEVPALGFASDTGNRDELTWDEPQLTGLMGLQSFDVLRSIDDPTFGAATCLANGLQDDEFVDDDIPAPGSTFFYLIRAVNPCGDGSLGTGSDGMERIVSSCN